MFPLYLSSINKTMFHYIKNYQYVINETLYYYLSTNKSQEAILVVMKIRESVRELKAETINNRTFPF